MRQRMSDPRLKPSAGAFLLMALVLGGLAFGGYSWKLHVLRHDGGPKAEAWILQELRQARDVKAIPREVRVVDMQPTSNWRFMTGRYAGYDVRVTYTTDLSDEPKVRELHFRGSLGTVILEQPRY